jgi:hypothetical protein
LKDEKRLPRGAGNIRYNLVYNCWLIGDNNRVNKYEPALNEQSKERFNLNKNHEKESKWLHNLSVQMYNNKPLVEIENYIKTKPNLNNAKGFEDQYNLLVGAYYLDKNIYDKAEMFLKKSINATDNRDKYSAVRNLTEIYMRQNVDKAKVKTLLDVIDDLNNDRIKYRAKDLEKKYNL